MEIPEQAGFCSACGAVQPRRCPRCHADTLPGARYWTICGTSLGSGPAPSVNPGHSAAADLDAGPRDQDAERRQLTVLFCDLVDSTPLSASIDPEEFGEIVRAYQEVTSAVVARFDGHVGRYLGDGVLAYFGYPRAHEDDAQRAVRAGLAMIEGVRRLSARLEAERNIRASSRRQAIHSAQARSAWL